MTAAIKVVEESGNSKIGKVSATYATQATCPADCALRGSGCYAEGGMVGMHTRKLNASPDVNLSVDELAMIEAVQIAGLSGNHPLRIHVVGDATTDTAARLLASAAEYHTNKHGQKVWTYTHAWRTVERKSWGSVSVFASCETAEDAKLAMAKGYAAAIVVSQHKSAKSYSEDGVKLIPCPQQTGRAATCVECGLCMRDRSMRDVKGVIAFEVHGQQIAKASAKLVQIGGIK